MKLKAFRVQNYKRIQDTGWVDIEDLTVFVGKNEAGKTALLRGLSKLRPTDGEKYDGLKEFPHSRYTDEFQTQDWPVASGRFGLLKEEQQELAEACIALRKTVSVTITRHYSDNVTVEFDPTPKLPVVSNSRWISIIQDLAGRVDHSVAPEGKGDPWTTVKQNLQNFLGNEISSAKQPGFSLTSQKLEQARKHMLGQAGEQWQKDIITPWVEALTPIENDAVVLESLEVAKQWATTNMPYFLYFGKYEVLDSSIYLPEFLGRINDKTSKTRVQLALFKHVGADIKELTNLVTVRRTTGGGDDSVGVQLLWRQ